MEAARAAFANAEGLTDVQVANVPGLRELLQVRAPADHDWAKTAAEVAVQQWSFEPFRADDVVVNLRHELANELAVAPRDAAARQRAWTTFGRLEPRFCAERIVLAALEQLVAGRATMWDPRLDEVEAAAVALRQFWAGVAPALEPAAQPAVAVGAPIVAPWTERVREALTRTQTAAADEELAAEHRSVTPAPSRWWAVQLACRRVAQQCAEVQQHAQRLAERTRDAAAKQAYAELARQCADIVGAVTLLTHV
jgi:hypothetical protein